MLCLVTYVYTFGALYLVVTTSDSHTRFSGFELNYANAISDIAQCRSLHVCALNATSSRLPKVVAIFVGTDDS